jgi:hypothetical protein
MDRGASFASPTLVYLLTALKEEFKRLVETCKMDKVKLPSRKEVDKRYAEMQELIAKPVTEVYSCYDPLSSSLTHRQRDVNEMIMRNLQRKRLLALQSQLNSLPYRLPEAPEDEDGLKVSEAEIKRESEDEPSVGWLVDPSARVGTMPGFIESATTISRSGFLFQFPLLARLICAT